jgi:hypothetical protein
MPSTPTTRFGFVTEADGDALVSAAGRLRTLATAIDSAITGFLSGTAASRPGAGIAGRLYLATDTLELSFDTGSTWLPGAWTTPSNNSPWTAGLSGALMYRRELSGMIRLRGSASGGPSATVIATLPAGFRPATALLLPVASSGGTYAQIGISTGGAITTSQANVVFDGITFPVS